LQAAGWDCSENGEACRGGSHAPKVFERPLFSILALPRPFRSNSPVYHEIGNCCAAILRQAGLGPPAWYWLPEPPERLAACLANCGQIERRYGLLRAACPQQTVSAGR